MFIETQVLVAAIFVVGFMFGCCAYVIKVLLDKVSFLLEYRAYAQDKTAYGVAKADFFADKLQSVEDGESEPDLYTQIIMSGEATDEDIARFGEKERVQQ